MTGGTTAPPHPPRMDFLRWTVLTHLRVILRECLPFPLPLPLPFPLPLAQVLIYNICILKYFANYFTHRYWQYWCPQVLLLLAPFSLALALSHSTRQC